MAEITQTISSLPSAPNRGVDSQTVFVDKAEALFDALIDEVSELNTFGSQANSLRAEVNGYATTATTQAEEATAQAVEAAYQATLAATSANNKGAWSLLTGALNIPATVNHNGSVWALNTDLADVTLSEPSVGNAEWTQLSKNINHISKSANYTAVANDFIYADTSTASFTITLPATPLANDVVAIMDNTSSFATNPLTVARNGNNIMGLAEDMVVDVDNISFELIFNGTEWRLK